MADRLVASERQQSLIRIPKWEEEGDGDAIKREFVFKDFKEAWAWMTTVAQEADQRDHHPEWFNVYNRVQVRLSTHTAHGVTEKDISLAEFLDKAATAYNL